MPGLYHPSVKMANGGVMEGKLKFKAMFFLWTPRFFCFADV